MRKLYMLGRQRASTNHVRNSFSTMGLNSFIHTTSQVMAPTTPYKSLGILTFLSFFQRTFLRSNLIFDNIHILFNSLRLVLPTSPAPVTTSLSSLVSSPPCPRCTLRCHA